jgi:hypothetical protein
MGLAKNTSYCYRVSAVDAAGNESGQSTQACATTLDSWSQQWGSAAADVANGIVRDNLGNTYVTGATFGDIDGQANTGGADAFVTKFNAAGVRQWTRLIGTAGEDRGQAVDVDSSRNVYVTGYVSGTVDIAMPHVGGKDVFLAKYNEFGTRLWYQQWGTATDNSGYGVKVDATATFVYVTGPTNEDLGGEATGNTIPNIFLSKRDASDGDDSGVPRVLYGTPNQSDYVEGIALSGGDIYLTGSTTGAFTGSNNATYDAFLSKFNTALAHQWTTQWGSTTHDLSHAVVVSGTNIYVTGSTSGSFGGQINAGGEDIFVTAITNAGVVSWTKFFGTTAIDRAYGIAVDGNDIYLTGETFGALAGTNAGQNDVFLIKCDAAASGSLLWARQLGTPTIDIGMRVVFDTSDVYVTGYTLGNLDGNISAGDQDVFLLKYDENGNKQ